MNEPDRRETVHAPPNSSPDFSALIASLRAAGAHRFDPARLHYIEALAKRATEHQGRVRHLLEARLAHVLAGFGERFDLARSDASETVAQSARQYPHAADNLRRLLIAGDFKAVRRTAAALKAGEASASLNALVRQLEQVAPGSAHARLEERAVSRESRSELKTLRHFRNTWSKISADKQLAQALLQAPRNAGPINSHMLVLRSLAMMRDISPDYLNRFMSYAETLLWLDQGETEKPASPRKPQAARSAKSKTS